MSIPEGYDIEKFVSGTDSVIAKKVWNAAIEAAAKEIEDSANPSEVEGIRRLKK